MMKRNLLIIGVFVVLLVFGLGGKNIYDNLTYETKFDETFVSPNEVNTILVRYDYVSRPSVFLLDGDMLFKYDKPGFMETVSFEVQWINDYQFILYNERYNEQYEITIPSTK